MPGSVSGPTGAKGVGGYGSGASEPAGTTPTLLPEPMSGIAINDAVAMLYSAMSTQRGVDMKAGKARIETLGKQRQDALAEEEAAHARERASQQDQGKGFWDGVGDFLGDTAGDVAHARFADACDDAKKDADAAWSSPKFWSDLDKGLRDIGFVANEVADFAQDKGGTVAAVVTIGALGVAASATTGAKLCEARLEEFAGDAQDARADATGADKHIKRLEKIVEWLIDDLKEHDKSHQRALQSAEGAMQTNDRTLTSITVRG